MGQTSCLSNVAMTNPVFEKIASLVESLAIGTLSVEDDACLEQTIASDSEARQFYPSRMFLISGISCRLNPGVHQLQNAAPPQETNPSPLAPNQAANYSSVPTSAETGQSDQLPPI